MPYRSFSSISQLIPLILNIRYIPYHSNITSFQHVRFTVCLAFSNIVSVTLSRLESHNITLTHNPLNRYLFFFQSYVPLTLTQKWSYLLRHHIPLSDTSFLFMTIPFHIIAPFNKKHTKNIYHSNHNLLEISFTHAL